jgi:hypothetical protein
MLMSSRNLKNWKNENKISKIIIPVSRMNLKCPKGFFYGVFFGRISLWLFLTSLLMPVELLLGRNSLDSCLSLVQLHKWEQIKRDMQCMKWCAVGQGSPYHTILPTSCSQKKYHFAEYGREKSILYHFQWMLLMGEIRSMINRWISAQWKLEGFNLVH